MEKYNDESRRAIEKQLKKELEERVSRLSGKDMALYKEIVDIGYSLTEYEKGSELAACFDEVAKTSPDNVLRKYAGAMDALVPKVFQEDFYYYCKKVNNFLYSKNLYRPTVRSSDYTVHFHSILYAMRKLSDLWIIDKCSLADLYSGKADEEITDYFFKYCESKTFTEYIITARLDRGDKALEDALYDVIMGEGGNVSHTVIRSVLMSDSDRLHEALCKLLLAAKLQEGLRQAICESADHGTEKAFKKIFDTITENELIRYSSVKRAVATWLGLDSGNAEAANRLTKKELRLISECLNDDEKRKGYLHSDDAVELYTAIWSVGFHSTPDAADTVIDIIKNGTRHQVLCASVYLNAIGWKDLSDKVAREALIRYSDDIEVTAAYFSFYLQLYGATLYGITNSDAPEKKLTLDTLHLDTETAKTHYELLWKLYDLVPKKETVFKPFVFPWYYVSISKGDIANRLCTIAYAMGDAVEIDRCCSIVQMISYARAQFLKLFAQNPKSDAQLDLLVAGVADKESYTQSTASEIALKTQFRQKDYITFEDMLKYKSAAIRTTAIQIVKKQSDDALLAAIERLLRARSEEMHLGALDITVDLSQNKERAELFSKAKEKLSLIAAPTTKEQILIDRISGADTEASDVLEQYGYGLYTADSDFELPPVEEGEKITDFFDSDITVCSETVKALDALVEKNKLLEYTDCSGEVRILGNKIQPLTYSHEGAPIDCYPFADMWRDFYKEHIRNEKDILMTATVLRLEKCDDEMHRDGKALFGKMAEVKLLPEVKHGDTVCTMIFTMCDELVSNETKYAAAKAMIRSMLATDPTRLFYTYTYTYYRTKPTEKKFAGEMIAIRCLYENICLRENDEEAREALTYELHLTRHLNKGIEILEKERIERNNENENPIDRNDIDVMEVSEYFLAYTLGLISEQYLYRVIFEYSDTKNAIRWISKFSSDKLRSWERRRSLNSIGQREYAENIVASGSDYINNIHKIYDGILGVVLPVELKRGDSDTVFSKYIHAIAQISGVKNFVAILAALGKEPLDRVKYYWSDSTSKRECLSHLLSICQPDRGDDAQTLGKLIKPLKISEKRLVEAAMYAPDWIPVVGETLGWEGFVSGCYYFIAHMKQDGYSEKREALIARFTPVPPEELANGAVDIGWFKESYETLGEKRFALLYDAAKYISDGARHSRARKYADAILGKFNVAEMEKEISEKRNKDTLMAYALQPLEGDTLRRYRFIQAFIKESKNFGAQRKQSEGLAGSMALRNLAENAGFSDTMRLQLAMETELTGELSRYFEWNKIGDISARIVIDDDGHSSIEYEKGGKALKNAPAALKKDACLNELKETNKSLGEQYSRTRNMFELAMEDRSEFAFEEIQGMLTNAVAGPMIKKLVYICDGETGLIGDGVPDNGKPLRIAHPYDLYESGKWHEMQALLFERQIKQPFKQVFRELYIKTDDERQQLHSLRYAGNQIQPKRTVGALKSRRWVADYEEGLQKIFYKENLVARIYALADWFSPADIEAPTLEWVEFSERKTGKPVKIDDVPDVIFSEVMRDVDLAVSVAHAGGVDPETSHSTIELRRAVVEFNLPLFGLKNVTLTDNHAVIKGTRAEYSIHLGSGVIHQVGGAQIAVLPVHSQHRGRIFLPFIDDDPKTAEIMSKIVLFAEDGKIKDPGILSQIR